MCCFTFSEHVFREKLRDDPWSGKGEMQSKKIAIFSHPEDAVSAVD
jgi:hypothetical protein